LPRSPDHAGHPIEGSGVTTQPRETTTDRSAPGVAHDPAVSVIVVNYNSGEFLRRCLAHLDRQTMTDFEVIVLDNRSTDGSLAEAQSVARDGRFRFMTADANLGFAAGNNRAAARARGRWLAFLNPDAFADPAWLAELLWATRRHSPIGIFGSTQISASDTQRLDGAGDGYFIGGFPWRGGYGRPASELPHEDYETFSVCGAAAFYDANIFRELGGFEESFFCYCEDVDLGFRARLAGHRPIQVTKAIVQHVGGGSGASQAWARQTGTRNNLVTLFRNLPPMLLALMLPLHLLGLILSLAIRPRLTPATLRGAWYGMLRVPRALRDRRKIQKHRQISTWALLAALSFTPTDVLKKRICRIVW
jgi:GT2 family glycosyltransferase